MKRWTYATLGFALLLAWFDGVATYFGLSSGWRNEFNLIPALVQAKIGLEWWLVFHTIGCLVVAVACFILIRKRNLWSIAYIWLGIEFVLCAIHIVGLILSYIL